MIKNVLILIGIFFSVASNANSVTIKNSGFEAQILSDGGVIGVADGWGVTGIAGTFNPRPSQGIATEGNNVATVAGGNLSQVLSETLTANTHYTLSVDVLDLFNSEIMDYNIMLLAGANVLVQDLSSLISVIPDGGFAESSLEYTALADNPFLGQQLGIVLASSNPQVNFDNVRLTAVSSVPVPAAVWFMGSGLLGLIGFSRKNKAQAIAA